MLLRPLGLNVSVCTGRHGHVIVGLTEPTIFRCTRNITPVVGVSGDQPIITPCVRFKSKTFATRVSRHWPLNWSRFQATEVRDAAFAQSPFDLPVVVRPGNS